MITEDAKKIVPGCNEALAINLSADTPLSPPCQRIWVGGSGNVKVDTCGGQTVTYTGVPAGTYLTIRATKIYSTGNGTSATNLVAER